MRRYVKSIWQNVLRYALLDTMTAVVILVFVYLASLLIWLVTGARSIVKMDYIRKSIFMLGIIYMFAILITSGWNHFLLIRSVAKKQATPKVGSAQPDKSADEDTVESKC